MEVWAVKEQDIARLKWFYDKYNKVNLQAVLTYKMNQCNRFQLSDKQLLEMDNLLKAIRQDLNKIFLAIKNIDEIYSRCETQVFLHGESETVAMYIEYIITKYRVIIEYTLKILDMIVKYEGSPYKANGKKMTQDELYNMKLDYLKELISDDRSKILNSKWFHSIRKTRNSIIHRGASCLVFGDAREKLFQIYDLDINELIQDDFYLYRGNCVYFDYFISLNIAYLCFFIDSVFSVILDEIEYEENENPMMQMIQNMVVNVQGEKQECIMRWVKNILDLCEETYGKL